MKKLLTTALVCATTTSSLLALDAEHAYLYKDSRIMGMGGANIAVGGYSTSVFANPAGLAKIKKDHGFVVDILGLGVSASEKFEEVVDDIDGVETDTNINPNATNDMITILEKHSGEHFHLGIDNYTSISKNSDAFAWSIGVLAASDINYKVHANGGASFLETSTRVYGGVQLGAAKTYDTKFGRVDIGLGAKFIHNESVEGGLTVNELISEDEDIATKLEDKYRKTSSGFGVDLGATIMPFKDNFLKPTFGISILNIGSMSMDDNYGRQPMTVNVGAAISPKIPVFESFTLAADYVDIFDANEVRFYNINGTFDRDLEDSDTMKRVRLGARVGVIDSSALSLAVSGGLYQGAYTAGVDLELLLLKLNVATYEEEIGLGAASNTDRRYMVRLGLGW